MFHMTIIMEDTILVATRDQKPDSPFKDKWKGQLTDGLSGKQSEFIATDEEFCAVLVLMQGAGEEHWPSYDITPLYDLAREALQGVCKECYPIP